MTIYHPPGTLQNEENFISRDSEHLPKKLIMLFARYGVNEELKLAYSSW